MTSGVARAFPDSESPQNEQSLKKNNWLWFEEKWGKWNSCPTKTEAGYGPGCDFKKAITVDNIHCVSWTSSKGELNSATTLASQPAARDSLSFIINVAIMTLSWGLFKKMDAESSSSN